MEKGHKNYLSAGDSILPICYAIFSALFFLELALWGAFLLKRWDTVKGIHYLMTVVVVLKFFTLFVEAFRYQSLKNTGLHDGWSIAYYVFSFCKGMMLFSTIVLIGTGWSYLKPFLAERDKHIMLAVLVVQFMVNLALVVLDEMVPGRDKYLDWRDLFIVSDLLCCFVIILPIVNSIKHLKAAQHTDDRVQRNLQRLQSFRSFYLAVVCYVYLTRLFVFLLQLSLYYEYAWVPKVLNECIALGFYGVTGYLFRPQVANPYFPIEHDLPNEQNVELTQLQQPHSATQSVVTHTHGTSGVMNDVYFLFLFFLFFFLNLRKKNNNNNNNSFVM